MDTDNIRVALATAAAAWDPFARAPSPGLGAARVAAHWGAQLAAAAGDSQGSLEWLEAEQALAGVPVGGARTARVGLRLADLTLLVLGAEGVQKLPLAGQTLQTGLAWLAGALARAIGAPALPVARPGHELPPNPIGDGAPFSALEPAPLEELAAWFSSADRVLRALAAATPGASPVRCWPHHFDIATLLALDGAETPPATARSLGVGLSPGDAGIAEPYWYVTPWPPPEAADLPALPGGGTWHRNGWFGAALTASSFAAAGTAPARGARVVEFLSGAIPVCGRLLGEMR